MLGCDGDGDADVGSVVGVIAMSEYLGGTHGSGVLSSACDMLEMSVVRGVGGVCDMCMCLARSGWEVLVVSGWVTGLDLDFINSGGTWGKWDMCVFG